MASKIRIRTILIAAAVIAAGIAFASPAQADETGGGAPVSTNGFTWSN